jgi:hypothetical protein
MEGLAIILWLLALILLPLSPQIVGFISYLLLRKHNDLVAHFLGVSIPPVAFFYLFKRLFHVRFDAANNGIAILLLLSLIQLIFPLLIHLAVHNRHKLKEEKVSQTAI